MAGFTLVELMVTLVISSLMLSSLFSLYFTYQKHSANNAARIDAVQELDLILKFVAQDLRNSIYSVANGDAKAGYSENNNFIGSSATTQLDFWSWAPLDALSADGRVKRRYDISAGTLRYDREASAGNMSQILQNVTFFKVFRDDIDVASRSNFTDIPAPLPPLNRNQMVDRGVESFSFDGSYTEYNGNSPYLSPTTANTALIGKIKVFQPNPTTMVPSFTLLIEIAIDDKNQTVSSKDVLGNSVPLGSKRVWRYLQLYPQVVIP